MPDRPLAPSTIVTYVDECRRVMDLRPGGLDVA